jgi:hypothetical protein
MPSRRGNLLVGVTGDDVLHHFVLAPGQAGNAHCRGCAPLQTLGRARCLPQCAIDEGEELLEPDRLLDEIHRPAFIAPTAMATSPWPVIMITGKALPDAKPGGGSALSPGMAHRRPGKRFSGGWAARSLTARKRLT